MMTEHLDQALNQPATDENRMGTTEHRREGRRQPRHGEQDHDIQSRSNGSALGTPKDRIASALGWFSLGLGIAEIVAPQGIAKLIGVRSNRHRGLIRAMGLRELASGFGIFTQRTSARGVWSRVGGDAVDLAYLGAAFLMPRANRTRVAAVAAAVAGVALLDVLCAKRLSRGAATSNGAQPVKVSLAIDRSPEELYRFWYDLENLPRFMTHLESVRVTGDRKSHWVAKGPAGTTVEWDAEITEDRPNETIAWRSLEGADVDHTGSICFEPAPGGRGTVVTVEMKYSPPGGSLGATVASLIGEEPNQTVKADLRRFKQIMEAGEVVTTEGQPAGRASSISWKYDQAVRR